MVSELKPTYDVGYEGFAPSGEHFVVVEYKGRKNILVRFDDGFEKNTTSTLIKQNNVKYTKLRLKCNVGDTYPTKQGDICTVVEVVSNSQVKVKFFNGEIKAYTVTQLERGKATDKIIRTDGIPEGTIFPTNSYGDVSVVKFNSPISIDVEFPDGCRTNVTRFCLENGSVGHPMSGLHIGYTFTNKEGFTGKVIAYRGESDVDIEWEDGSVTCHHRAGNIRKGSVYFPNQRTVVGVGYFGIGKYKPDRGGNGSNYNKRVYDTWMKMIIRCYSEEEQKKPSCKAYIGVKVCDEWHNFQNFALWAEDKLDKFISGYEIDKDLFGTGWLYCPDYCRMLPERVNWFLSDNYSNKQLELPEGVNIIKPKTSGAKVGYVARCAIKGKREYLGYFNTPEEAGRVYREAKEGEARRLAEEYKHMLETDEYDKLYNFTLEDIHQKHKERNKNSLTA